MKKLRPVAKKRSEKGFVLISVLVFAITAIVYLMAILPLIDSIVRLESFGRSSSELRTAAETGIDYALEQLNKSSAQNPGVTCPLINAGVTSLPLPYLKNLPNGTITVNVKSITGADWSSINNNSTIYNSKIDPKLGTYLVVDSEAKRGLWRNHIRVFLQPCCNIPSSESGEWSNSTASYFKNPLIAQDRIDANYNNNLTITKSADSFDMLALNSITATDQVAIDAKVFPKSPDPTIYDPKSDLGQATSPTFDFPPVPSTGDTTEIQTDVAKSLLGSYTSHGNNFTNVAAPLVVDTATAQPAKIYIQDVVPSASTTVDIDARVLKNNSSDPQNMQLWYNGNGKINLNLTSNFTGLIYAPNAKVELTGSRDFHGAIVANAIDLRNSGKMTIETSLSSNSERNKNSGLLYAVAPTGQFTNRGYKAVSWQEISEAP